MTKLFLRIYQYLSTRKPIATVLLLAMMVAAVALSLRVSYEEDIAKFLPHRPQDEKLQQIYEQIAMPDRIAVLFTARDSMRPATPERMEQAMEAFGQAIEGSPLIDRLQVTIDETQAFRLVDFVSRNSPYFLSDADWVRIDSLLRSPDYVARRMEENKKLLLLPTGGALMPTLRHDPLGLFIPVLRRMQNFRMGQGFQIADGYLFTADGKTGLVTMNSRFGSSETRRNAQLAALLDSAATLTQARYPELRVSPIGAPLIAVTNASTIKTDAIVAVGVASLFILALLWWHYRRLSDMLWIGVSIVFGWLFAIGGMALFHDNVSIIVLGIGSVIIGIAVNYPLHFLDHIREVADRRQALREMVPPLLIGNVTTVAAFLCLVWLDARAMRDLGLFGALMLIGTILFVLVFLPLYARQHRAFDGPRGDGLLRLIDLVGDRLNRPGVRRWVLPVVVGLTLVFGYFSLQTSFDSNLANINYMRPDQKQDLQLLTATQNEAPCYAVAEGTTLTAALQANDKLLTALQEVGCGAKGIGDFAPTAERQGRALAAWKLFWTTHHGQQLVEKVKTEAVKQGFKASAFQPFYDMMATPTLPIQPTGYFNPVLQPFMGTYILPSKQVTRIVNDLHPSARQEAALKAKMDGEATKAYFVFSAKDIGNRLVRVLNDSFNYIGLVCGCVVFFFLWLSFGKIELSLLSFLPLAVSWVWILGMMEIGGIQFNIVNIILATFIFGQGDDYTIFITEGLMYEYATGRKRLKAYKHSVAISALLMFIGIGSLTLARHPAMKSLGTVTMIGMFTVVLMAYYLPPLVFRRLTMRKGRVRDIPLTLYRVAVSLWAMVFFLTMMYFFVLPYTYLLFHIGKTTEQKRLRYHRLLHWMARFIVARIPGVAYRYRNDSGESFDQPAIIMSNHLSHFDTLCLMTLHPKMIFLTNSWAWNNPFYSSVIHAAEFLPASDGLEQHLEALRSLYERGYSICIFPEGTRSLDHRMHRFHKGGCYLAELLGADIVPVVLHGHDHVLPKTDFMLRKGTMTMHVLPRIKASDSSFGTGYRERTSLIHRLMESHYADMKASLEDFDYMAVYLRYLYRYKGADTERRVDRLLRHPEYRQRVNHTQPTTTPLVLTGGEAELGLLPLLMALRHPERPIEAIITDEDDYLIASNLACHPANLTFIYEEQQAPAPATLSYSN